MADLNNSEDVSGLKPNQVDAPVVFKDGDVIEYSPYQYHCYEGTAIAQERDGKLRFFDTYWGSTPTEVTSEELVNAAVLFNLNDFRQVREFEWQLYAKEDRRIVSAQHHLQKTHYVRIDAAESLGTQIAQAREKVAEAESDQRFAVSKLEWAWRELTRLEAKQDLSNE